MGSIKNNKYSKKLGFAINMRISSETPFPSVGEIVLLLFKYADLWELYPLDPKWLQKKLERFKTEEIVISRKELNDIFEDALRPFFKNEKLVWILADAFVGILFGYAELLKENGSFLSRKETCRWMLRVTLFAHLVITIQEAKKLAEHPDVKKNIFSLPSDIAYFLPSRGDKGWVYPCSKIIRWWFDDVVRKHPDDLLGTDKKPSTFTVRDWLTGKSVPEMSLLLRMRKRAFALGQDEAAMKDALILAMLLARISEHFFKLLIKSYGDEEVETLIKEIILLYTSFEKTVEPIMAEDIEPIKNGLWEDWKQIICRTYETFIPNYLDRSSKIIPADVIPDGDNFFVVAIRLNRMNQKLFGLDDRLATFIYRADKLLKASLKMKKEEVVRFDEGVGNLKALAPENEVLRYYLDVLLGRQEIFHGDLSRAFEHYLAAFHAGRYAAGSFIKQIILDLMGLCAYQFTVLKDEKGPREKYWVVLRYLRDWVELHRIEDNSYLQGEGVKQFIESRRRYFQDHFREYLPHTEELPLRIGKWDSLGGPEALKTANEWKPNFRHTNSEIKNIGIRDNSQLMTALLLNRRGDALRLIEAGADLNYRNSTGDNPFTYAMSSYFYDVAEKILEGGVSLDTLRTPTERHKNNAIKMVISHRQPRLLKRLLELGIGANERFPDMGEVDITPLYRAIHEYGKPLWKEKLPETQEEWHRMQENLRSLEIPYKMERPDKRLQEIFEMNARIRKEQVGSDQDALVVIQILVEAGVDLEALNINNDRTALSLACELDLPDVVSFLLEKRANPNFHSSALSYAILSDSVESARLLISHGADPTAMRVDGKLLLDLCLSESMRRVILEGIKNWKPSANGFLVFPGNS